MPEENPLTRRGKRVSKTFTGKGKTDQTAGQNQQVGKILAEYRKNGTAPRVNAQTPLYGDFTGARDLQSQMESYQAAEAHFARLPGKVREAADNNMIQYVEMMEHPTNDAGRIALVEAGLEIEGFEIPEDPPTPSEPSEPPPAAAASAAPPADPLDPNLPGV